MPELNFRAVRIAAQFDYERASAEAMVNAPKWSERSEEFQRRRVDALAQTLLKYLEAAEAAEAFGGEDG